MQTTPAPTRIEPSVQPTVVSDAGLSEAIKAARTQSAALLDQGRFAQAAEVLDDVIVTATEALGADSPRVLPLRSFWAAVLVIGGDFRRALPEFDALAAVYVRISGPDSQEALDCLRQAAYCRAELGEASAALRQFNEVLTRIRDRDGDATPTALDLRRNIGMLLLSEGKVAEATAQLSALHQDLLVVYGPDHEETQEVADVLTRLSIVDA